MQLKKFLLFGLIAAVLPAFAEEAADRKTATSLKYVTHELDTRQDKFTAETNKAMEYTNTAGDVQKRTVKSDLGTSTSDTSLPMVGGVNTKLNQKQDDIAAVNDHTAVTYNGQPGNIGQKGIYQTTESYAAQSDNLIDAKTFNAAIKNGLDSEFICSEYKPDTNLCWVYSIHNNGILKQYVSATGTGVQDGTPTPTNPIYPKFFQQGSMILRKVGEYADSFDATTHKITRRVGVKVLDGTNYRFTNIDPQGEHKHWFYANSSQTFLIQYLTESNFNIVLSSHFIGGSKQAAGTTMTRSGFGYVEFLAEAIGATTVEEANSFLTEQYAAGTPVTVWYPLETPVEEDWPETTYNENIYIPQNQ